MSSVEVRTAGVRFGFDSQGRVLTPGLAHLRRERSHKWALRGVDLSLRAGDGVGLVGPTGSGKTTLLRILAGVLPVDEGSVTTDGRVGTLLSTEAGLTAALSGAENTELLAVLGGMTVTDARVAVPAVRELSGLGDAFDRPVAGYSDGMRARLGFAVTAQFEVDVLLLDEVHEALDHEFRAIVAERAHDIRRRGGIIVMAGHDHAAIESMCDRAVWLEDGKVAEDGGFTRVAGDYVAADVPRRGPSRAA